MPLGRCRDTVIRPRPAIFPAEDAENIRMPRTDPPFAQLCVLGPLRLSFGPISDCMDSAKRPDSEREPKPVAPSYYNYHTFLFVQKPGVPGLIAIEPNRNLRRSAVFHW